MTHKPKVNPNCKLKSQVSSLDIYRCNVLTTGTDDVAELGRRYMKWSNHYIKAHNDFHRATWKLPQLR